MEPIHRLAWCCLGFAPLFLAATANAAGTHVYVLSQQFPAPPASLAAFDPSTANSGPLMAVPPGAQALASSPDGREIWIASATNSLGTVTNNLSVVTVATGAVSAPISLPVANQYCSAPAQCLGAQFSPDGSVVYLAALDQSYYVHLLTYSASSRTLISNVTLSASGSVTGFLISPDGSRLFLQDSRRLWALQASSGAVLAVRTANGGKIAASGKSIISVNGSAIQFTDMKTLTVIASVPLAVPQSTTPWAVSRDGARAVVSECVGYPACSFQIEVFDLVHKNSLGVGPTEFGASDLAFSPDGSKVAVLGYFSYGANLLPTGDRVETYDATTFAPVAKHALLAHAVPVYAGKRLFFYYNSGLLTVIDQSSAAVVTQLPVGGGDNAIASIPQAGKVYAATSDGTAVANDSTLTLAGLLTPALDVPTGAIAATAEHLFVIGNFGLFATNLSGASSQRLPLPNFNFDPSCLVVYSTPAASRDGTRLIISADVTFCSPPARTPPLASGHEGIGIYDAQAAQLVAQVAIDNPGPAAFAPDNRTAYVSSSTSAGSSVQVVDAMAASVTGSWLYPSIPYLYVQAVSPDGSTLYALGGNIGAWTAYAIDTASGAIRNQYTLPGANYSPWAVLTADGTALMLTGFEAPYSQSLLMLNVASGSQTFVATNQVLGPLAVVP